VSSLWLREDAPARPPVTLSGRPDAIVVGGGVSGCSCALALAERGLRVRLHEAREIAGGASGRNGGFALRGGAMSYPDAVVALGHADARALWRLSERALNEIEQLAGDALRRVGSLRLAADDAELDDLRAETEALAADGFEVEALEPLPPALAGLFAGGLRHLGDGALQPARWVRRLAARAAAAGVEIRDHAPVAALAELDASHVVIATDGYTHGLVPELDAAIRPTRGQVLVTEPLAAQLFPGPHYARHGYDYWQQLPDGRLVLGGRRDAALDAEWTAAEAVTEPVQTALEDELRRLLRGSSPRIEQRWSGIWGTTADSLPLAGRLPGRDGVWVAAGYSGHGNVLGFACGKLVAAAIAGEGPAELSLFDPARLLGTG
jgi:glycine/D-amino acid oxidase-like deaminating enzyme